MITAHIRRWAHENPEKVAVIHEDAPISYAALAAAIESTRRFLASRRPPPGSTAAILARDARNAWVLVLASRSLGLTTLPVTAYGAIAALAPSNLGCVVVAEDERHLITAEAAAAPKARAMVVPPPAALRADSPPEPAEAAPAGPFGAHILYTSGTTGEHKRLIFEAELEDARCEAQAEACEMTASTVYHALDFGLWTAIGYKLPLATWMRGGTVVIDQRHDRHARFLDREPTYAIVLPETLKALVAARPPSVARSETLTLRVAGGFTPFSLAEQGVARMATRLLISFSATELSGMGLVAEFHELDDLFWLTPAPGRRVEIVDEEGVECPVGVEGELRVRLTDLDSHGYLEDPAASARAFRDGCFYPGDLAMRREDGRVRVLGRAADVINIKGQKRPVAPIEQQLQRDLGVDEVCLFVKIAEDGVEELFVAVQTKRQLNAADIERRLGPSEIFDRLRVEVLAAFPRTENGKTRRAELRRMLTAE